MDKIALMSWSLYRELPNYFFKGWGGDKMTLLDLPAVVAGEFGLRALELCETQFPSIEMEYVSKLKAALDAALVKVINISVDSYDAGEPDHEKRRKDIAILRQWFQVAKYLGSPSLRITTGNGRDELTSQRVVATFRKLKKSVQDSGVKIVIENHDGVSRDPDSVLRIIEEVGPAYVRTSPDFGNFDPEVRLEGLRKLLKHADIVHVKMVVFGPQADDYLKSCLDVVKASGFDGYYSIEYSGPGEQREGVQKTMELLRHYFA